MSRHQLAIGEPRYICLNRQLLIVSNILTKWDSLWSSSVGHVMISRWLSRHPFQWTTSQITFASAGDVPMKTSLNEGVQKLQRNAPNTEACSVLVQK